MIRPLEDISSFYSANTKRNKRRGKILKRDGNKCKKCGSVDNLTLDHIKPKSKGGTNEASNLQILCEPCNTDKADTIKEPPNNMKEWSVEELYGDYDEIKKHFGINDMIKSLKDGVVSKFSGYMTQTGHICYDSFNKDLVLYKHKEGKFAEVIVKDGIDHEHIAAMKHIQNVRDTCRATGLTPRELAEKGEIL